MSTSLKELEGTNIANLLFLMEYLTEHANGVILWVVLIMKELRVLFLDGFWTLGEIRQMLSSIPQDLEQCYEEMVRRIMKEIERGNGTSRHTREQCVAKTQMMLSWPTFFYRPLSVREFRDIMAIGDIEARKVPVDVIEINTAPISSTLTSLLSVYRLHSENQVHRAVLYFGGGCLESGGGPKYSHTQSHQNVLKTDVLQLLHRSAKDSLLWNTRAAPFQLHAALVCFYHFIAWDQVPAAVTSGAWSSDGS